MNDNCKRLAGYGFLSSGFSLTEWTHIGISIGDDTPDSKAVRQRLSLIVNGALDFDSLIC